MSFTALLDRETCRPVLAEPPIHFLDFSLTLLFPIHYTARYA
jgi:hypothetical protein